MAINRTYNYNGLRSEVTKEIKEVVSEGATQGLTEGMAEALAQGLKGKIKINGSNIVFDDSDLRDGIKVAFNKAISDLDIKDAVKKQGLDISQLFNIDANALKQEIEDSLTEVDINPKSIKANKKLLGQLLAAEFRGIEVKDLDGAAITQSFVKSIQRAAKISNEQIADINDGFKQLGDSSKQLDVFAGNVTELLIRMQNAADGINDTKREIAEFNRLLEGLDDQSFDKINDSLDEFQEKIQKGVMSASEAFAELKSRFNLDTIADDLKEFNSLLDMTLTGFGGKSKPSAQQYWKSFRDGFETANADVKELLKNLGLLNQSGGVDVIESGANNYGGIVGEQNTAIIRKNNGNITPENALELKNALDQAADAGVNCGRIIDVVSDKTNEFFVEVQSTQAGKAISTIGDEFESINTAALEASDEQIQKLFSDLKKLYDLGIQIDPENLTNILYDPSKGFAFIDLDLGKGDAAFKSFEEMISAFRTTLGYQVDDIKTILEDEAGSKLMEGFVKRIANASSGIGDAVADLQRAGLDELAKSLDSHSPSKKAENIGESVPQGEAKGIRNEIPEAEKAAKELGQATMDALEKELKPVSGNQYADILNRSFETKNKTEANNQLKSAYAEFQKYFSEGGIEDGKILREMSDAGRKAGYEYYNALEEAVRIGVSKSRIEKYLSEEFWGSFDSEKSEASKNSFAEYIHEQARVLQELGNPKLDQAGMKALSDYMERWDLLQAHQGDTDLFNDEDIRIETELLHLMREELEAVVNAKQQTSETRLIDEQKQLMAQMDEVQKFHQIREGSIVAEQAAKEVGALKEVAEVVTSIVKNLQEASSKKINISFKGLESLNSLVGKDLTGIVSALQSLANVGEVNMSVKTNGIKGLEALTKLDIDKLDERLKTAYTHIETFAQSLNSIEIKDDSLFDSLRNLLKDGEALKSLAASLKASKKQIDNVTEAVSKLKQKPQTKVDLSEWKELNKVVKEYYELKNTDSDKLTQSEQGRLTEIEGLWAKVRGEVEKTTAALKEQGQSTKLIEDVTRAYATGFAEWQNQRVADSLISDRTDLSKLSERFNKRLSDYPSKYVEEAAQKVQKLTTMVDALNAKPIDAAKPEDIAQIEKEIEAAKTLANEIQQGFNSADWRVANQTKVTNLQNEISMYMKNFSALSEETKGKLRALNEELDHVGSNEGLAQAVQKFNKIKIAARDAGEEGTSFFSKMGKQIEHLNAQAFAMYLSWQDIIRYIRQAAGAVIELDSALTELRKVSDASTERLQQSFETSAKTAKELGSTVDSVINQTADWSRLNIKGLLYSNV